MRVSKQFITISVLLVLLTITCCANNYLNAYTYDEDMILLDKDGNTQYFWKYVNDDCVIYAKDRGAKEARVIAVFPPDIEFHATPERKSIVCFVICDEWLVASVGYWGGFEKNYFGDFARFKKDGSEITHFILTASPNLIAIDGWIYYNFWEYQDKPEYITGCYRIRPDGSDKQYLGDIFSNVMTKDKDGYLYGEHDTDKWVNGRNPVTNLIRWKPGDSELTILFEGDNLPKFDNADLMGYWEIELKQNYVIFTAFVHGNSEGDSWRGRLLYNSQYRVNKNGSNLILLRGKNIETNIF